MATGEVQSNVNSNLQKQDLNDLDISQLTALSPEVISRQATINIGTIGHVAHGKSTVVKAISGVQTVRFKNELERNITIKLERLSDKRVQELLSSKEKLLEYEALEDLKLIRMRKRAAGLVEVIATMEEKMKQTIEDAFSKPSLFHLYSMRDSSTPSSGYESLNDNASVYSSNSYTDTHAVEPMHAPQFMSLKRRRAERDSPKQPTPKRAKKPKEYVVQAIQGLECADGSAVVFVKWLNFSAAYNTWESVANVYECTLFEEYVKKYVEIHKQVIEEILSEINEELKQNASESILHKHSIEKIEEFEPIFLHTDLILLAQFRLAAKNLQRDPRRVRMRVMEYLELQKLQEIRVKQLEDLNKWERLMNLVERQAPVTVENKVDLECLSFDFTYIDANFPGPGVHFSEEVPIGCNCQEDCKVASLRCCARLAEELFAYDKNAKLRLRPGSAIYECNKSCSCNMDCLNRVIQRGRKNKLCLYKTPTGCGWGVRTEAIIKRGDFVSEYVGEIITAKMADQRGEEYDAIGRTYLFDLDYNTQLNCQYTIDAAMYGNISHFFNHSCDPNLAVFPFFINNLDIYMPRLAFFALRQIRPGEELTFDYMRNDYQNLSTAQKVTCRCGAANCRKVLF